MLREKLGKELLFFDGGMGTLLQKEGMQPGELPETWNIEKPEVIRKIHASYVEAGSQIVLTNTFGANRIKYHGESYSLEQVINAAVENVRSVSKDIYAIRRYDNNKKIPIIIDKNDDNAIVLYNTGEVKKI